MAVQFRYFFILRDCGDSHSFLGLDSIYKSNDNEVTKFEISTFSAFTRAETAIHGGKQRLWTELVVNWIMLRSVAVCSSQQGAEKLQNLFHWSSHLLCAGYYIVITAILLPPVHSDPSTWILLAWWAELQFSDKFVKESSSHSNSYHFFLHILLPMGRYQYFSSVPWNFAWVMN